jgi:FKBP-type peptidyl-prolyl cis-trans isomerase
MLHRGENPRLKRFCFLCLSALPVFLFGGEPAQLSSLDCSILDGFFHHAFEKRGAGYVLLGDKPIYWEEGCQDDAYEIPGTPTHRLAVERWEATRIWKRLTPSPSSCYLQIMDAPGGHQCDVLFINQPAFIRTVSDNLLLFRAKLGTQASPEPLMQRLCQQGMSAIEDPGLRGIVLGYGVTNSLLFERSLALRDAMCEPAMILYRAGPSNGDEQLSHSPLAPSFGFQSLKDEYANLSQRLNVTRQIASLRFELDETSAESKELLSRYQCAEKCVNKELASPDFLRRVLERFGVEYSTPSSDGSIPAPDPDLAHQIAGSLWELYLDLENTCYDEYNDHFQDFIDGFQSAEDTPKAIEWPLDLRQRSRERATYNALPQLRSAINELRLRFQVIASRPSVMCVHPNKLYYEVIRRGVGDCFGERASSASMHYLVRDLDGNVLCGTNRLEPTPSLDMERAIPGLRFGLFGMQRGEIREIYVHPDFAHGRYCNGEPSKALCVRVELMGFEDGASTVQGPGLVPAGLGSVCELMPAPITTPEQVVDLERRYFRFCGQQAGSQYRSMLELLPGAGQLGLPEISKELQAIRHNPATYQPLTDAERSTLRRLHWLTYNSSATSN